MKKYTPYIFPLIVVVIVFFLVYRWYSLNTQRGGQRSDLTEGIQVENLSPEQVQKVLKGSKDVATAKLQPAEAAKPDQVGSGSIRYEISGGKVNFTVSADLAETAQQYHVWVRSQDGDDLTDAFVLEMGKGGYTGSAAVPEDLLPLEVIVSTSDKKSEVLQSAVLQGVIAAPAPSPTATPGANN